MKKPCVICGKEFEARSRTFVVCGDEKCCKKRETQRVVAYQKRHPLRVREAQKEHRRKYREPRAIYTKLWKKLNRDKCRTHAKRFYGLNREIVLQENRLWRTLNRSRVQTQRNTRYYKEKQTKLLLALYALRNAFKNPNGG